MPNFAKMRVKALRRYLSEVCVYIPSPPAFHLTHSDSRHVTSHHITSLLPLLRIVPPTLCSEAWSAWVV